jgi:hypothetical protein
MGKPFARACVSCRARKVRFHEGRLFVLICGGAQIGENFLAKSSRGSTSTESFPVDGDVIGKQPTVFPRFSNSYSHFSINAVGFWRTFNLHAEKLQHPTPPRRKPHRRWRGTNFYRKTDIDTPPVAVRYQNRLGYVDEFLQIPPPASPASNS